MVEWEAFKSFISETLSVDPRDVIGTARLEADLAVDSLELVELGIAINEQFGLDLQEADLQGLRLVLDVYELLRLKMPGPGPGSG